MMKARIGAALLVGLISLPSVAIAQDATRDGGQDRDRVDRQTQIAPEARFQDDGAIEVPFGPRAIEPRFGDYAIEPEVENRFAAADEVAVMRPPSGKATALMIAGAALLVAGLIIEDDAGTLVAVAGAAVGAYGVYLYFS